MKTQGQSQDVLFLSGVRTGFGSFGGTLKDFTAIDLGVIAAKGALERSGVEAAAVDHVVFGNALQTSADAIYLARHVALKAGLPIETPAVTVNRLCGSGFESIIQGAQQILLGESADRPGRRRRVDEPGAPRGARRALGAPARPGAAVRGPALGIAQGSAVRLLDGGDGREPGRQVPDLPGGGGRLRPPQPAARA